MTNLISMATIDTQINSIHKIVNRIFFDDWSMIAKVENINKARNVDHKSCDAYRELNNCFSLVKMIKA